MPKHIAFIRVFANVPIGFSVEQMLRETFPEYELDVYEVTHLLKQAPGIIARNGVAMLRSYGRDILQGHKSVRRAFWGTPYIFRQSQRLVQRAVSAQKYDYAFTFQLQSMVNANPGLSPHFIYTDHTHLANIAYENYDVHSLFNDAWIREERILYQSAAHVFTRSSNISRSLETQYNIPSEKVSCVYAGVNVPPKAFVANGRYHSQNILFVGTNWEQKGGPQLVEALQQVRQTLPQVRLTIVGDSPSLTLENCQVVGLVPVDQVGQYFEEATLFCLPTRLEAFGVAFIEAMAYRLPIIAPNLGAIPDFVADGENGYLVALDDTSALADALLKLLQDPQKCEAFGQRGYSLFQTRYNWEQVGKAIRKHVVAALTETGDVQL